MEEIDIYGDGLATELNVSQAHTAMKTEPVDVKPTFTTLPLPMPLGIPQILPTVKSEPTTPLTPAAGIPGVTYVTQDTFAQQNKHQYIDPSDPKSKTVYVGNLTWWTTDEDLVHACRSLNVSDVHNVRFHENRSNGQSKGYCSVDLGSINSAKTLLHELRNVSIHSEHPYVAIASKTPLYYFEQALGIKNEDNKTKKSAFEIGPPPPPPVLPPVPGLPGGIPGGIPGLPPPPLPLPVPGMNMMGPPPGCLPPPMPLPPPPMGLTPMLPPPPDLQPPPAMLPPVSIAPIAPSISAPALNSGAHINPAFLPSSIPSADSGLSEQEKTDMIDRNHQVCKTAILRAYESCDSRDYDQAEGTVAAALKIIKMSAVSDDGKSKSFIADLEECLNYVQKRQKKSGKSRSGSHRTRDRPEKGSRRRSRSHEEEPRDRKREKRGGGEDRHSDHRSGHHTRHTTEQRTTRITRN